MKITAEGPHDKRIHIVIGTLSAKEHETQNAYNTRIVLRKLDYS
jgi:hypothetical protein